MAFPHRAFRDAYPVLHVVPLAVVANFVPLELEAGLRHVLPFDYIDAVVPLDLCQLGFKFRYLVLVILRLPPEVQSAEDKEVLVLTGLVAKDCAREGLSQRSFDLSNRGTTMFGKWRPRWDSNPLPPT